MTNPFLNLSQNPFTSPPSFQDRPLSQLGLYGKLARASSDINSWLGLSKPLSGDYSLRQANQSIDTSPMGSVRAVQNILNVPVGFTAGSLKAIQTEMQTPEAQALVRRPGENPFATISRLPQYLSKVIKPKKILEGGVKGIVEKQQPSQVGLPEPIGMAGELVGRIPQLTLAQLVAGATVGKIPFPGSAINPAIKNVVYASPLKKWLVNQGARIAGLATEGTAGAIFGAMQPSETGEQLAKNVGANALGFLPFGLVTPGMNFPSKVATLTTGLAAAELAPELLKGQLTQQKAEEVIKRSGLFALMGSLGGPKRKGKGRVEEPRGPIQEGEIVGEAPRLPAPGREIVPGVPLKSQPAPVIPGVPIRPVAPINKPPQGVMYRGEDVRSDRRVGEVIKGKSEFGEAPFVSFSDNKELAQRFGTEVKEYPSEGLKILDLEATGDKRALDIVGNEIDLSNDQVSQLSKLGYRGISFNNLEPGFEGGGKEIRIFGDFGITPKTEVASPTQVTKEPPPTQPKGVPTDIDRYEYSKLSGRDYGAEGEKEFAEVLGKVQKESGAEMVRSVVDIDTLTPKRTAVDPADLIGIREEISSGARPPLVVDENRVIRDGNHRYIVYKELGVKEVPVISPTQPKGVEGVPNKVYRVTNENAPDQGRGNYYWESKELAEDWAKTPATGMGPAFGKKIVKEFNTSELPKLEVDPNHKGALRVVSKDIPKLPTFQEIGKKTSVSKLEEMDTEDSVRSFLGSSKGQDDFVKRVKTLEDQLDKPENAQNTKKVESVGKVITKELHSLVGAEGSDNWKRDYYLFQTLKEDPAIKPSVDAMERLLDKINSISPKAVREAQDKAMRVMPEVSELVSDNAYLPRDKYIKANTQNDNWVKGNIAFYRMGNKRGMLGYIFNALGVENKDVQSVTPEQIQHLSGISNVEDLFGGSGLLSVLSRSLFPSAKITYNEFSPEGRSIITAVKDSSQELEGFLSVIHQYIRYNPTADWFAHFRTADPELYKNPTFKAAMLLVEANRGRSLKQFVERTLSAIPGDPITNTIRSLPKYSEHMNYFGVTFDDAFRKIDNYINSGTTADFLWIDPPYLWATGYGTGAELESAQGFVTIVKKLEKLSDRGVKFVFFNTDPQSKLDDITKIPQSELDKLPGIEKLLDEMTQKMVVVRNIHPIGAQGGRTELMITNITFGVDKGSLVAVGAVRKRLAQIREVSPAGEAFVAEDVPLTTQVKVGEKRAAKEAIAEEKRKLTEEKTQERAKAKEEGRAVTLSEQINAITRMIRESSLAAEKANKATDQQIRTIRSLRSRASVRSAELTRIMDGILEVDSLARLTKPQADQLIDLLQPRNWDKLDEELKTVRKEIEEEKLIALSEPPRADNPAIKELEDKYGVVNDIHRTRSEIKDLADRIRKLPEYQKRKEAPLAAILPLLPESAASKIAGMQREFQIPMRNVINISNLLTHRLNLGLKAVFKDLTPEELEMVLKIQAEASRFSAGSDKEKKYANYLQAIFGSHLALVNNVRQAAGLQPLHPKERYLPYIIDENLKEAVGSFDKNQFVKQRLKTAKDFLAGMFTHDPERIADVFSGSAGDYLKRDLYKALLSNRLDQLKEISETAYTYGKAIVDKDVYSLADANRKFASISGDALNDAVGRIFPKKVKVTQEFADAVMNTHWAEELKDSISKGYLEVPRVSIPSIMDMAISVIYPLKLSWNLGFGLLNRTQPAHGIPFVGTRNFVRSRLKLYSMAFPWNKSVRKRYFRILAEGGYEYGRFVGGDELEFHNKAINFVSDLTELMNRTESMVGAETYLGQMEKKLGMSLSESDKQRVMAAFSNFINYLSGKGYSPLAQRSSMGKAFYVFNQYPLNMMVTYTEMAKMAMKDKGAREFWKLMGEEGGASEKAYEFFDKLPKGSKANVFRIFLALAIPVAILFAFSQSWEVAKRGLPGWPKVTSPLIDFAKAFADFVEDPERNADALVNQFQQTFSSAAWGRLETALGGSFKIGRKEIRFSPDQAWKVLIWGKSATQEYARDKELQERRDKMKRRKGNTNPFLGL